MSRISVAAVLAVAAFALAASAGMGSVGSAEATEKEALEQADFILAQRSQEEETAVLEIVGSPQPASGNEEIAQLLSLAPADTWFVIAIDAEKILAAPAVRRIVQEQGQVMPDAEAKVRIAFFLQGWDAPVPAPGTPPRWSGAIRIEGMSREELIEGLASAGPKFTVEGVDAYLVARPPAAAYIAAFEDGTMLFGASESSLGDLIKAYRQGKGAGLSKAMADMTDRFAGDAIYGGFVMTEQVRAMATAMEPGEEIPLEGAAYGLAFGEDLDIKTMCRFINTQEAQAALAEAREGIAEFKSSMLQPQQAQFNPMLGMFMPFVGLLDKVQFSTDGADLNIRLKLTIEDLRMLVAFGTSMAQMFGGMMGSPPGMMGPPGMPTGPPPSGAP